MAFYDHCMGCNRPGTFPIRLFPWHYVARKKNRGEHCLTELDVELCDFCYYIVTEENPVDYTSGWDWWDAVDGICFPIEDYYKEHPIDTAAWTDPKEAVGG